MKLAIMQPYFFPYIGYFQLINAVDKYIIYDNLNFIKDAWINRNRILIKNSGISLISVPLIHKSSNQKIRDIEIDDSKKWRDKFKKTLSLNYKSSPMFIEVFPILEQIINFNTNKIAEFNINMIKTICRYIGTETLIESESARYQVIEDCLRDESFISAHYPDTELRTVRILELCKYEDAGTFYNAIGGTKLYSKEKFASYSIELKFLRTRSIEYKQFSGKFTPDMSIIDVLMFNETGVISSLIEKYELV